MRVTLYRQESMRFLPQHLTWGSDVLLWRWTITAANGLTVGASTQGYSRRIDAVRNLELITGRDFLADVIPGQFWLGYRSWPVTVKP